jgi:hypothetical protein
MAKKSKGFAELVQQQRDAQLEQRGMNKLRQKIQNSPIGEKIGGIVTSPEGVAKMSEVLEEFIEPYLDTATNSYDRKILVGMAVMAWNLALMPASKRQPLIKKFILDVFGKGDPRTSQDIQDIKDIINELIGRKLEIFPDNQRFIVEFQLQETRNQFHLSVASTLMEPDTSAQ